MIGWDKGIPFSYDLIMNKYALENKVSVDIPCVRVDVFHCQCIGEPPYIQIVLKTRV